MLKYILAIIIVILIFIVRILKNIISQNKSFILKTVLLVLLLEVTVFNINAYRTDFGNLKYMSFVGDDLIDKVCYTTEDTQYISLENVDSEVKSVFLELDNLDKDQVIDYDIFYSDKSTSPRYLASKSYCQDVEKTKYSCISLSRNV